MRCDICDHEDSLINYNKVEGRYNPCHTCQAVIDECIAGYGAESEVPAKQDEVFDG